MTVSINISKQVIDINKEYESISCLKNAGAVVTFTGQVRAGGEQAELAAMVLEHYPGMTENSIRAIVDEACGRWPVLAVSVIHRVGHLLPGECIVWVGVAAEHRGAAFAAAEFIMDYLKARAPFWKKEITATSEHWVDAREKDTQAASRW